MFQKFPKLLANHRSLRGSIVTRVKSALFAIFGEQELPYIDTKSTPQEIKKWKDSEQLKNAYEKLYQRIDRDKEMTWCARVIQKVWPNFKKLTKEKIAFGMAVCQYTLNPKTESIKINDEEIRKIMKVNKVSKKYIKKFDIILNIKILFIHRKS